MFQKTIVRIEAEGKFKGKTYFENYYNKKRKKPWFDKMDIDRRVVCIINRLRANHYNLNESLERKGYITSAMCKCGAEYQDISHVAFSCIQFDDARGSLYRDLTLMEEPYPYEIRTWLRKPDLPPLKALHRFLVEISKTI